MTRLIVSAVQCEYRQLTPSVELTKWKPKGKELDRHTSLSPWEEQRCQDALAKGSLATNLAVLS